MQNSRIKQKKFPKFRLLLDSAFAKPSVFKKLCKKAAVKHIRHDLKLSPQTEDKEIYNRAAKENMFVVTINYKDFKKFVRKGKPGILALDSGHSNSELDSILANFIKDKNPQDYFGKATKVK